MRQGASYSNAASHTFAGKTSWYMFDGLGSVVGEVDPLGNLTSSPKYDVYGAVRSNGGSASSKQGFVGSLGHVSDDTGLIYMRARYYDSNLGRFVSEDPKGSGANWFAYCDNNPINEGDVTGQTPTLWGDIKISVGNTAEALGFMFALAALFTMAVYKRQSINFMPNAPGQMIRLSMAINLSCLSTAFFGFAALGLTSGDAIGFVLQAVALVQTTIIAMAKGAEAGQNTAAGLAVLASFTYGLAVLGYACTIGADAQ